MKFCKQIYSNFLRNSVFFFKLKLFQVKKNFKALIICHLTLFLKMFYRISEEFNLYN